MPDTQTPNSPATQPVPPAAANALLPGSLAITFATHTFHLLSDRALFWPAASALIIADLHLGKAASFRAAGVPVPEGPTAKDLARLTALLHQTAAQRLIILGDLLHSRAARQTEILHAFSTWRAAHSALPITLIRGNHDHAAGPTPTAWSIHEVNEPHIEDNLAFLHHPDCPTPHPALAGHVHPVTSLSDFDGTAVTVPCFIHDETCLTLPAFGTFTGGHAVRHHPQRELFVLMASRVIHLPKPR